MKKRSIKQFQQGGSKRPKQDPLPGTTPPADPVLTKLANDFADAKAETKLAREREKERGDALILKLKEKGLKTYDDPDNDLQVVLENQDKVKVTRLVKASEEEETEQEPAA